MQRSDLRNTHFRNDSQPDRLGLGANRGDNAAPRNNPASTLDRFFEIEAVSRLGVAGADGQALEPGKIQLLAFLNKGLPFQFIEINLVTQELMK